MWGSRTHHLVYEVVDNSIDEAMGGYCDNVVDINEDGSITVEDNGWYPVVSIKKKGFRHEVVMTKIGAGGNLIRIPIKCLEDFTVLGFRVNALSNHLRATVHVVTVKCMSKSMKRKALYPVKQIETTKEVLSLLLS
jgi:DNA gyrase subunit B